MYNFASKVATNSYISRLLRIFFVKTMRKYFFLLILPFLLNLTTAQAQVLFTAPDTVCVRQPVTLTSINDTAANYYWGFCSGSISKAPTGLNMGNGFGLHTPSAIDIVQDLDGLYYGFVLNAATDEFIRFNYGNSLNNIPTVTNFGNLTKGLPHHPTSMFITFTPGDKKWFIFVTGGYFPGESALGRIDFGPNLHNPTPNVANMGNLNGAFDGPRGVFVAKDDATSQYFGYVVNRNSNDLIRLDFSFNISNTPIATNLGDPNGALNYPTDMAAIKDNGNWYLFVTNRGNNSLARLDLGTGLDTIATDIRGYNLGDFLYRILVPSSITLTRDCGSIYAYITDSTTSQLIGIEMPTAVGPYTGIDYSIVGAMAYPSGISSIIRGRDDIYAFICNVKDSSITRLEINQCTNSTIPSFREVTPPVYSYTDTGWYNIYYVINEGLPNMQVECKQIRVQPIPNIYMNLHPTICRGDSIHLYAISNYADSFAWSPNYHIDTVYNHTDSILVWPDITTNYHLMIHYPDGCIVDTNINVEVIKVVADAGPDRTIADGSETTLGGPYMSLDDVNQAHAGYTPGYGQFSYAWSPNQYIDNTVNPFPHAKPPFDYTYFLEVSVQYINQYGIYTCKDHDTVTVHINCGDIYLPNAFSPASANDGANRFGILNNQLTQLNYFRIFNRWGAVVFETTNPANFWDGTFNGKPAPADVYVWIADGFCQSGKAVKKKGNVTLLR